MAGGTALNRYDEQSHNPAAAVRDATRAAPMALADRTRPVVVRGVVDHGAPGRCASVVGAASRRQREINREYAIKAAYLYQFGRYVQWPASLRRRATLRW